MGQALGTMAIWAGNALVMHLLHSYEILSKVGAAWMIVGAIVCTIVVWKPDAIE